MTASGKSGWGDDLGRSSAWPASMGILIGLLLAAFVFRVLLDNAAWAQALFDWLGPFGAGHALVGVVVIPGLFALLAHGLGDR